MDFRAAKDEARDLRQLVEDRGWRASQPDRTTLTLLTTRGQVATKTIRAQGVKDYDKAAKFHAVPVTLEGINDLADLLGDLADRPHTLVIADAPRVGLDLAEPVPRQGVCFPPDPGRELLMLDIDDAQPPEGMAPTSEAAARWVRDQLPDALQGVACVAQFSATAGLPEAGGRVKVHLWFLLDRRGDKSDLKAWAKAYGAQPDALTLDPSLFSSVQAHYTAAPIFDGRPDPFDGRSQRLLLLEGERERVSVDALERFTETHAPKHQQRERSAGTPEEYAPPPCGWTGRAADYLTEDALGVHRAITRLTWEFARDNGPNVRPERIAGLADHIRAVALENLERGLLPGRDAEYIEDHTDREQIDRAYRGAVDKGACLRRPESAPRGFDDAGKALRRVATGKASSSPYGVQDYAYNAALAGTGRLGPMALDDLLATVADAAGQPLDPNIHRLVERFWHQQETDTARMQRPPRGALAIDTLEQVEIRPGALTAVRAPHGTGKTKNIAERAILDHRSAIVLSHRISLTEGHAARLGGIFGVAGYRDAKKIPHPATVGTAVTANSLPKVLKVLEQADAEPVDCVVIDEATQVLRHIAGGGIPKREKRRVLDALRDLLSRDGLTIVLLDADLDRFTVDWFAELSGGKPVHSYNLEAEQPGEVRLFSDACTRGSAPAAIADAMLSALAEGVRVALATDSKQSAQAIGKKLEDAGHQGGIITADTPGEARDAFDRSPDSYPQAQGWQFLIYSPAIAAGVSLESGYFGAVFGLYTGVVLPTDFIQMLLRVRTVRSWTVAVATRSASFITPLNDLEAALLELDTDARGEDRPEGLDGNSRLILDTQDREKQARQWYALKLVLLFEHRGWEVNRILANPRAAAVAEELAEIIKTLRDAKVVDVLDADQITEAEADRLKKSRTRTRPQDLALARHLVCHTLRLDPDALTGADVRFYQQHPRGARDVIALFAAVWLELAGEPWADLTKDGGELIALRQWLPARAALLVALLRGLGVGPGGEGSWTKADAAQVLPEAIGNHKAVATVMGLARDKWTREEEALRRILLGSLGLKVITEGTARAKVYRLHPETLAQMIGYAARVFDRVARVLPDAETRIIEHVSAEAFFSNADLPRWAEELLRTAGVVLVDRRWIEQQCGVSRATAKRYRKEAEGIAAEGLRRWSVDLESDDRGRWSCVALTVADDPERVVGLVSQAAHSRVEGVCKNVVSGLESIKALTPRVDKIAHPPEPPSAPDKTAHSRVGCGLDRGAQNVVSGLESIKALTPRVDKMSPPAELPSAPVETDPTAPQAAQAPAPAPAQPPTPPPAPPPVADERDDSERRQARAGRAGRDQPPESGNTPQDASANGTSRINEEQQHMNIELTVAEIIRASGISPSKAARLADRGRPWPEVGRQGYSGPDTRRQRPT
jgi:hypothetical protein